MLKTIIEVISWNPIDKILINNRTTAVNTRPQINKVQCGLGPYAKEFHHQGFTVVKILSSLNFVRFLKLLELGIIPVINRVFIFLTKHRLNNSTAVNEPFYCFQV